ncbi:MAG: hypothetical protein EPN84_02940 [Legionella sp.]|nr:MAG: hypothetical protein EPN84_02940 [Legionella sp.]
MTKLKTHELEFQVKQYSSPKKTNAYKVKLFCKNIANNAVSPWKTKIKCIADAAVSISQQSVTDIYSLNFDLSAAEPNPFHLKKKAKQIAKELNDIPSEFHSAAESTQVIMVLDIKMKESGYNEKAPITEKEQAFLALFNQNSSPDYIKELQKLGLQYVFLEGSLKADLLNIDFFDCESQEHLKNNSADFCQMVEFIINAFKRGEQIVIKQNGVEMQTFNASDYIKKISPKVADYQPTNTSITLYPKSYHEIAMQGIYTKAMQASGFFKLSTSTHDASKIVHMTTEMMAGVNHA